MYNLRILFCRVDFVNITLRVITLLTIILTLGLSGSCFCQSKWELKNPIPLAEGLHCVTYANNQFVAVGDYGTIITSSDGANWVKRNSGTNLDLSNVFYSKDHFYVTYSDTMLVSADGINWSKINQNVSATHFAFGNGIYVAVSWSQGIYTSNDLSSSSWAHLYEHESLVDVIYANDRFVAVGSNVFTSTDGKSWTQTATGLMFSSVAYGKGLFAGLCSDGSIYTSSDGSSWAKQFSATKDLFFSIAFGAGHFAALGRGKVISSPDGKQWSIDSCSTHNDINSVTGSNDLIIGVGENGAIVSSTDGTSWVNESRGSLDYLASVTFAKNKFVAVGTSGTVLTSPDGNDWTKQPTGFSDYLTSITFGNNCFVATAQPLSSDSMAKIYTSPDGISWTPHNSGTYHKLSSVAYGNNTYMAVGAIGEILTSHDGISWTEIYAETKNWNVSKSVDFTSVVYGDNQFVIIGNPRTILCTHDGTNWTLAYEELDHCLQGITYGGNQFVCVDPMDLVFYSSSGLGWQRSQVSPTTTQLQSITYGYNQYVAVGRKGAIFTSPNAIDWTAIPAKTPQNLMSVTSGNNRFVAVGDLGNIIVSDRDSTSGIVQKTPQRTRDGITLSTTNRTISIGLPVTCESSSVQIQLVTLLGKCAYRTVTTSRNIAIAEIPRGTYMLRIQNGKTSYSTRICWLPK